MQTWNDLLEYAVNYKTLNPEVSLEAFRTLLHEEPIVLQNRLTFGEAKAIDDALFGNSDNEYWLQAYNTPQEDDIVFIANQQRRAKMVGIFTFAGVEVN